MRNDEFTREKISFKLLGNWSSNTFSMISKPHYFKWIRNTHQYPFVLLLKTIQPNLLFAWVCYILHGFTSHWRKNERIAFHSKKLKIKIEKNKTKKSALLTSFLTKYHTMASGFTLSNFYPSGTSKKLKVIHQKKNCCFPSKTVVAFDFRREVLPV